MKHYLDLVPISVKIHRKQSRMSIFCIVLAVFLVTTILAWQICSSAARFCRPSRNMETGISPSKISAMKKRQLSLHAPMLKYFRRMVYLIIVEI